jgi:pilus assembly protein TadC
VATGTLLSLVFTLVIGFLCAALFGMSLAWLALMGLPLGFFAVVAHLKSQAKEREVAILRAMPYAIDLLVLMLRSGTSLRIALGRVIDDYQRHPLGIELGQVVAEIDVGSPRVEAFKKMAERLKVPDITALVDAIVQSEELGWPLADTLERLADRISNERILAAQAKAGAAGVYVMLPSTFVLMSAVLLLFAVYCEVSGYGDVDGLRGVSAGIHNTKPSFRLFHFIVQRAFAPGRGEQIFETTVPWRRRLSSTCHGLRAFGPCRGGGIAG